jgi:hypothetical protein
MVKFKGAGSTTKAPDTSGVQRAHEGVMGSMARGQQAAGQAGQLAQSAGQQIQQQGQFDQEQQARKERLDVEMAKGGLQFQGQGVDKRVVPTEGAQKQADLAERKVDIEEQRASNEARRAAAYEMSQQLSLIKSGYTENGELTDEGRGAIKNLSREYKKQQRLFEGLNRGDPAAIQQAQAQMPSAESQDEFEAGVGQMQKGFPDQAMGMSQRLVSGVKAAIDYHQLKFVVNAKGEMPEDVMDDSQAWTAFHGWKQNIAAMMRSGRMMTPNFRSLKERNRFLNEASARMVLRGREAEGSLADPSAAQGLVPAQAPAGQPDDGSQQPQQALPPGADPLAAPGTYGPGDSAGSSPPWANVQ